MNENVNSASDEQDDNDGTSKSAPDASGKLIPDRVVDELLIMTWPM